MSAAAFGIILEEDIDAAAALGGPKKVGGHAFRNT
jgi:hypothetical protein